MTKTVPCHACHGTDPACEFCEGAGQITFRTGRYAPAANTRPETKTMTDDTALIEWAAAQTWSSFATDVAAKARRFGSLTERQRAALVSMKTKCDGGARATETAREERRSAAVPGFGGVISVLDHIDASGNKWPALRLEVTSTSDDGETVAHGRMKIYRYQTGQNMGSAGIKLGDTFLGNIDRGTGEWAPTLKAQKLDRTVKAAVWGILKPLTDDVIEGLSAHGLNYGFCACCGKALSNDVSVQRGIGPECWAKLGGMV